MDIRQRAEGTQVEQGVQVTRTPFADYFYFRKREQVICVRLPAQNDNGDRPIEVTQMSPT